MATEVKTFMEPFNVLFYIMYTKCIKSRGELILKLIVRIIVNRLLLVKYNHIFNVLRLRTQ